MTGRSSLVLAIAPIVLALTGCGSSEPEHPVKPFAQRPPPSVDINSLSTPEAKIKYIENSKAPESVKQQAIEQIRAGKL